MADGDRDAGREIAAMQAEARVLPLEQAARIWVECGGALLPVSGRSMKPTCSETARLWIERGRRVRFGDILVYTNGPHLVAHRVIGVRAGPRYRTKGDGLPHKDPGFVTAAHVLGTVAALERGGVRRRANGTGGRIYGRAIAFLSAAEGLLYGAAWRLDRLMESAGLRSRPTGGIGGGFTLARRTLRGAGRIAVGGIDSLLFRPLNPPERD